MEYEVQAKFNGLQLSYELIVKTLGKWWGFNNTAGEEPLDAHWGPDPIRIRGEITNAAAAFDVSGYRVEEHSNGPEHLGAQPTSTVEPGQYEDAHTIDPRGLTRHISEGYSSDGLGSSRDTSDRPNSKFVIPNRLKGRNNGRSRTRSRACVGCLEDKKSCHGEAKGRADWMYFLYAKSMSGRSPLLLYFWRGKLASEIFGKSIISTIIQSSMI